MAIAPSTNLLLRRVLYGISCRTGFPLPALFGSTSSAAVWRVGRPLRLTDSVPTAIITPRTRSAAGSLAEGLDDPDVASPRGVRCAGPVAEDDEWSCNIAPNLGLNYGSRTIPIPYRLILTEDGGKDNLTGR